jgi:hypothetical protein
VTYQDKVDAALAVVNEHNEALGHGRTATEGTPGRSVDSKNLPGFVNPDEFISCVKASGGTSADRLAALSHEDILECLPTIPGPGGAQVKPRILAKAIAQVFRAKDSDDPAAPNNEEKKRPVSAKKADRMTPRELVEAFDPEDFNSPVGVRLATISRGEPFIVFDGGRAVNVETTLKLLLEVKQGYKGREDVDVGGAIKKVYRLGELPENYADENPLYRGRPLRPDGTCDQTGRSWEGVDLNVRQLVRVAMDEGELHVTHEQAHNILDMVMEPNAFDKLRKRYRKSAIKFDELAKTGDLPTLKIELGGSEGNGPFAEGKRVVWAQAPNMNAYLNRQQRGGTFTSNIAKRPN